MPLRDSLKVTSRVQLNLAIAMKAFRHAQGKDVTTLNNALQALQGNVSKAVLCVQVQLWSLEVVRSTAEQGVNWHVPVKLQNRN